MLRYEDYFNIYDLLSIGPQPSIIGAIKALKEKAALAENAEKALAEKDTEIENSKKELKKSHIDVTVANQEKIDNVEGSKKIVGELKNKEANYMKLSTEKKTVEETIQAWKPIFDKAVEKRNAIFPICGDHLETCSSLHDEVCPFYVQFEPHSLEEFDVVTKEIDEEIALLKAK